jgi:hypothetical protein
VASLSPLSPAVEELAETFQLVPDLINNQHRKRHARA